MKRNIITTADGSSTIQIEEWNEQYHSVHGAIQEANHVYIKHGFLFRSQSEPAISGPLHLLEIGFGTGLNAMLTYETALGAGQLVNYVGVEAFPVASEELAQLNYVDQLEIDANVFKALHESAWNQKTNISEEFSLHKQQKLFKDISEKDKFDVIYFDAFGPRVQPELWDEAVFKIMFDALREGGVLSTYCAKGSVRRAMQSVGFLVERLPGPPGKREMLRARKQSSEKV